MARDMLTIAEERDLVRRAKAGDTAARNRLVEAHDPLAGNVAKEVTENGAPTSTDDLMQEARIALLKAVNGFDPGRGVRFNTYAYKVIRTRLINYIYANMTPVSVPPKVHRKSASGELNDSDQRDRDAAMIREDPDEVEVPTGGEAELVEVVHGEQTRHLVRALVDELPERDRDIVRRRYIADPPDTLREVAEDYGLVRERIRQLEARALTQLRKRVREVSGGY
jgi:RNA polymerase sigma factor (sigma-70 family)